MKKSAHVSSFIGIMILFVMTLAGCGGGGGGGGGGTGSVPATAASVAKAWAWMSGPSTALQVGIYGTKGVAAAANVPGPRSGGVSWTDVHGNLWLFGGYNSAGGSNYFNDLWKFDGTNWTWVSGSSTVNQAGTYGTKGVAAAADVPGARSGAFSWIDGSGNLWLFGGLGYDSAGNLGYLNDLWKFDGTNWTWVSGSSTGNQAGVYGTKGVAAGANVPGARCDAVSWIDGSGNLWLFGGLVYDSTGNQSIFNDLWKFDGTNWTWVSGSSTGNQAGVYGTKGVAAAGNVPGARCNAVSWIDGSGNLWLFGGSGGFFSDLWKFDGTNWTWVSGSSTINQAGVYGTKGVAAGGNVPGARCGAVSWFDSHGNLWLFGGGGYDSVGNNGNLNDLWKFDGVSWTWVSGASTIYQTGVYGTKGVADPANLPGSRGLAVSWTDAVGNFWLFGGTGIDAVGTSNYLNDLWKFDGTNWTWVSGSNLAAQAGTYGTKGVAAAANVPGARQNAVSWTDLHGNLWLFGGVGNDLTANPDVLNDLWKFNGTNWTWVSGSSTAAQAGGYGTKGVAAGANVPGARSSAVSWIDARGNLWLFGGEGYDSAGISGDLNDLWKFDGTNWTWVSGSNLANQDGVYGTNGVAAAANVPGARCNAFSWIDSHGNLWLFGGYSYSGNGGTFNDLWKFDGTNWTWVSGSNLANQDGVYGTKGVAAGANVPGAQGFGVSWIDSHDNLWFLGGLGYDSNGSSGNLNDLWKFDGTNWTWVSGSNTVNQVSVYGTKGVGDPANTPGAGWGAVSWTDRQGNFWLGYGNQLWRYGPY